MMLEVPVRGIGRIHMQFYASLENLHGFLPVEVIVADEGGHAPLEILKSVLVVTAVTTSLLVKVPRFCQFPNIVVIRSIVWSYRGNRSGLIKLQLLLDFGIIC